MVKRHTEWRHLVNANCDSSNPKLKSELLQDLKEWEKAQSDSNINGSWKPKKGSAVMEKNFDRIAWAQNHDNDFRNLIAQARAKSKKSDDDRRLDSENTDNVGQPTFKPG